MRSHSLPCKHHAQFCTRRAQFCTRRTTASAQSDTATALCSEPAGALISTVDIRTALCNQTASGNSWPNSHKATALAAPE